MTGRGKGLQKMFRAKEVQGQGPEYKRKHSTLEEISVSVWLRHRVERRERDQERDLGTDHIGSVWDLTFQLWRMGSH